MPQGQDHIQEVALPIRSQERSHDCRVSTQTKTDNALTTPQHCPTPAALEEGPASTHRKSAK